MLLRATSLICGNDHIEAMFEQRASGSQFAHILRMRERQFSPGAILHGCVELSSTFCTYG